MSDGCTCGRFPLLRLDLHFRQPRPPGQLAHPLSPPLPRTCVRRHKPQLCTVVPPKPSTRLVPQILCTPWTLVRWCRRVAVAVAAARMGVARHSPYTTPTPLLPLLLSIVCLTPPVCVYVCIFVCVCVSVSVGEWYWR